jgi:uncharacterized protein YndB with AHSA1/START domain
MMHRDLVIRRVYPYPRVSVWESITDSRWMSEWLMPNDFEPRVGAKFQFRTKPAPGFDGIVHCEVLAIEPPRRVSYRWRGGGVDTVVTFTLEEIDGGTELVLTQTGFSGVKATIISVFLGGGWKKMFDVKLPAVLARRSGGPQPPCGRSFMERVLARIASWLPKRD